MGQYGSLASLTGAMQLSRVSRILLVASGLWLIGIGASDLATGYEESWAEPLPWRSRQVLAESAAVPLLKSQGTWKIGVGLAVLALSAPGMDGPKETSDIRKVTGGSQASGKAGNTDFNSAVKLYQESGGRGVPHYNSTDIDSSSIVLRDRSLKELATFTYRDNSWTISELSF